jgi:hypothetical protein
VTAAYLADGADDFHVIGSMGSDDPSYAKSVRDLQRRIKAHKSELRADDRSDAEFEFEREQARHDLAAKKMKEEETRKRIESDYAERIGGVLQKMEVFREGEARASLH